MPAHLLYQVVDDARTKYAFDFSRIYLTGYSMVSFLYEALLAMTLISGSDDRARERCGLCWR